MNNTEIQALFESHGGVMKTSELKESGIQYRAIQKYINEGIIEQIRRGYYQYLDDKAFTDIPTLVALFPEGVLCMESALDYYGYTERTPSAWHIAVDDHTRRNRFKIEYPAVKPHFITRDKYPIGIVEGEISGMKIKVYDRERTICDCLLHKNKMDSEVYNNAIKNYLKDPEKNVARLGEYAPVLHVEKKVREVIGVWL